MTHFTVLIELSLPVTQHLVVITNSHAQVESVWIIMRFVMVIPTVTTIAMNMIVHNVSHSETTLYIRTSLNLGHL